MKYFIKIMIIMLCLFIFTNVNAEITYNSLSVSVEGIDSNNVDELHEAYLKLSVTDYLDSKMLVMSTTENQLLDEFPYSSFYITDTLKRPVITSTSNGSIYDNTVTLEDYEKLAEISNNVYAAIYTYNHTSTNYDRISSIVSITRPSIPIDKRFDYTFSSTMTVSIYDINGSTSTDTRNVNYKIGEITDKSILNDLKDGVGYSNLLNYAKNRSSYIKTGTLQTPGSIANPLNSNQFTNNRYYFIYSYRDKDNNKYVELEGVNVFQYVYTEGDTNVILVPPTGLNFSWNNIDDVNPQESRVEFENNSIVCTVGVVYQTYVVSSTDISLMSSSNENIATVSENTGGNRCPSTLEGCREIKVSCLRAGTATITAKNTDNKQATMSVEVSEEIIPVTITYSLEDGVTCSNDTKTVNSGTKWGALCTPTKKGYKFDGWYTEETGGTKVTKDTVARGDITVYARWSIAKNPETGLFVPITLLLLLLGSSVIIFIILTKRTKQFNQ